jgi:F-type H+-transporting ATPase subunit a
MVHFMKTAYFFLFLLVWNPSGVSAVSLLDESTHDPEQHSGEEEPASGSREEEDFQAGEFIMEHVRDSYEWHLTSFNETHICIPLPVILYNKNPGLHEGRHFFVFMSSKFHHGHSDYKGFRISTQKKNNGKIVELDEQGAEKGRPLDFSMTKTVSGALLTALLVVWIFLSVARSARRNKGKAPRGLQNLFEPVILFVRDEVARPVIGEEKYERFMPFLLTLFFFILINNLTGLIPVFPFGANVTGNISVTLVLALFTFLVTVISGNRHYWKEVFNPDVPLPLKFPVPLMQVLEILGMFTKPFVLMIRLFANMLAGHMILAVFVSLIFVFAAVLGPVAGLVISPVSIGLSIFILLLDILVSFIQAYVFTLLSALYFGMATAEHH